MQRDFNRYDVTDTKNLTDGVYTSFNCRTIRIGSHKFDPKEKVTFTSKGVRIIAPSVKHPEEQVILDIQHAEIVKILISFQKPLNVIFLYTFPSCSAYVRESLEMGLPTDNIPYYNSASRNETHKRITLLMESISNEAKAVIKTIFNPQCLEEIILRDANELLLRSSPRELSSNIGNSTNNGGNNSGNVSSSLNPQDIHKILIYPQGKGGISINTEDYMCLAIDQYLNDVIIDFYLNYLRLEVLNGTQRDRTHVFSTFFYKRLTTVPRQKAVQGDVKLTAAQKRHERVKNWTKNVNLFEKEFIIIPINEQSHWFLAIICYPGLMGPVSYDTGVKIKTPLPIIKKKPTKKQITLQIGNTTITPVSKREQQSISESINLNDDDMSERDEAEGDESELGLSDAESGAEEPEEEEETEFRGVKQPCILIFDSLAGASRSRVVATLRDYLTCEYKAKVLPNTTHTFNKDNMPGNCVKVPQQNNFTDCGLYLLQYVEEFFSHPIKDFRLPVRSLQTWFETIVVTRKREEIANLIQELVTKYNPSYTHPLPEIQFPTLNGRLLEREEDDEAADFEEEEIEDDPNDPSFSSPEKANSKGRGRGITMAAATSTTETGPTTKKTFFKRTLDDKPKGDPSASRKRNRMET